MNQAHVTVEQFHVLRDIGCHIRRHPELGETRGTQIHWKDVLTSDDKGIVLKGTRMGIEKDARPLGVWELAKEIPDFLLHLFRYNELICRLPFDKLRE